MTHQIQELKETYSTDGEKKLDFLGFDEPKENWSRLPHEFIASLPLIDSLAELKVVLYVLRHTWGYKDNNKRISIDEFRFGRKKKKNKESGKYERIDNGTGMSENAIRDGIARAIDDGFIEIADKDESDKARVKVFYRLKMTTSEVEGRGAEVEPLASEVEPRTKKETIERNYRKNTLPQNGNVVLAHGKSSTELWDELESASNTSDAIRDSGVNPILPEEIHLFEEINKTKVARNRRPIKEFQTVGQREKFRKCVSVLNGFTNQQVDEIIANGKREIDAIVNALYWRINNPKGKFFLSQSRQVLSQSETVNESSELPTVDMSKVTIQYG